MSASNKFNQIQSEKRQTRGSKRGQLQPREPEQKNAKKRRVEAEEVLAISFLLFFSCLSCCVLQKREEHIAPSRSASAAIRGWSQGTAIAVNGQRVITCVAALYFDLIFAAGFRTGTLLSVFDLFVPWLIPGSVLLLLQFVDCRCSMPESQLMVYYHTHASGLKIKSAKDDEFYIPLNYMIIALNITKHRQSVSGIINEFLSAAQKNQAFSIRALPGTKVALFILSHAVVFCCVLIV